LYCVVGCIQQAPAEEDDEAGESVPINMQMDGGKFMEEFFEQVCISLSPNRCVFFIFKNVI